MMIFLETVFLGNPPLLFNGEIMVLFCSKIILCSLDVSFGILFAE